MLPLSGEMTRHRKGPGLRPAKLDHIQSARIPEEPAQSHWIHAAAGSTAVPTPLKFSGSDLWIWVAAIAA